MGIHTAKRALEHEFPLALTLVESGASGRCTYVVVCLKLGKFGHTLSIESCFLFISIF